MNLEITSRLSGKRLLLWRELIESVGLTADTCAERTVLVFEDERLVATGGRDGSVFKFIAVSEAHRGEDLLAVVLTELRRDAFAEGYSHLFLYTKPGNRQVFESIFFYPIVESESVLFMESERDGINRFLSALPPAPRCESVGAIVMNCDPFTLGHKHLIETAARECDRLFVFVLSEEKGKFSAEERIDMVRLGTAHIQNVSVHPTGPYLISSATFPTYFLKNRDMAENAACGVDVEIFAKCLAPRLKIKRRYVGTEPRSPLTDKYNQALAKKLPQEGIEVRTVERLASEGEPISASRVRSLVEKRDTDAILRLVPETTADYLRKKNYI